MTFHVEITDKALADIEEAYLWLAENAPEHAASWYNDLLDTIDTLEAFPSRCSLAQESASVGREVRQLLYGKRAGVYRILFQIQEDTVFILRVRHGAREWLKPEEFNGEE